VCARGSHQAPARGRSASSLDVTLEPRKRRALLTVLAIAGAIAAVPLGFVAFQMCGIMWDRHRVVSTCAKLTPGTTLQDARVIITSAGLGHLLPHKGDIGDPEGLGGYDKAERNWFFSLPVAMEYGDERCGIYHDGKVVLKAGMEVL
jgi:hypothetical protein